MSTFWLKNILIPLFLAIPILCFALPVIPLGTENIEMIRHFDADEGSLIAFAGKTYSQGVIPLEYNVTYPQLFYYLAGVVLFPFTFLKGINHHVIVIALRSFNLIISITTVVFLYFFCLRFFKSIFVGILSSLMLATTPGYISWIINSRPHLLEIAFLLATLYFCFKMADRYQFKYLMFSIIFAGLATATKFGGIFMIPVIWCSYVWGKRSVPVSTLVDDSKSNSRKIAILSSLLMIISILIPIALIFVYPRIAEKLHFFGIKNFNDYLHFRNFRIVLLLMVMLFACSFFWFFLNRFSYKFSRDEKLVKKYPYMLTLNKSLLVLFCILIGIIFIFFICNPYYLLYPRSTVKEMGFQFAKSTMGTAYDPGLRKPILGASGLIWIRMLFENSLLNIWFGLLLLYYFVFESSKLKKNFISDKTFIFQRILLLIYSIILFLVLVTFLKHRTHHYLLPILITIGILISYAIVETIKYALSNSIKLFLTIILSSFLILGFYNRIISIRHMCEYFMSKPTDTGIAAGKWLENRYDKDVTIWKDTNEFYIPPKFKNIYFMHWQDNIVDHFLNIKNVDPDILIITNELDKSLKNAKEIDSAIQDKTLGPFKLIKRFDYQGPLAFTKSPKGENGLYPCTFIYEKVAN